jgi:hypothetical protein
MGGLGNAMFQKKLGFVSSASLQHSFYYGQTIFWLFYGEGYGCGIGVVGGCVGEWGIEEGGTDCVIRKASTRSSSKCSFQINSMSISIYS